MCQIFTKKFIPGERAGGGIEGKGDNAFHLPYIQVPYVYESAKYSYETS